MKGNIYISHAPQDQKIVSLFSEMILCKGSGVRRDDIVFSAHILPELNSVDRIRSCRLFIMMVSDHYHNNGICLNEMGASWMREDISRVLVLLPKVTIEEIGWLSNLKKEGIQCTDGGGLDSIHDLIVELFSVRTRTATWNYYKSLFIQQVTVDVAFSPDAAQSIVAEQELDLLDIREFFDEYCYDTNKYLSTLSKSTSQYGERLRQMTTELNIISSNPQKYDRGQIREVFLKGAQATEEIADIYEHNATQLKDSFGKAIEYGIMIQRSESVPSEVKVVNREEGLKMANAMMEAWEELKGFRHQLNQLIDIDKNFKNAKNRLIAASDKLLDVFSFCINQATAFRMS